MQFLYRFSTLVLLTLLMSLFSLPVVAGTAPAAEEDCAAEAVMAGITYYVRTDGNDNNDGRADNSSRAVRTIQKGVDLMSGGDILIVNNGTYNISSQVYIDNKNGTSNRRTIIRSKNRWGAKIRTSSQFGGMEIRNSDYITVDGFDIGASNPNSSNNTGTGLEAWTSNYVEFKNNYVHDCGCGGISFREGDYATIQLNVVRDNAKISNFNCSGISVYQPNQLNNNGGFHIIIRRNVAFENECDVPFNVGAGTFDQPTDGNGIILDDFNNTQSSSFPAYKAKTLIENNLAFNNGGAGIKVFETDNATIRHNTTWHNCRILKNYSGTPGEIAVTYSPGIFEIHNNVAVSLNDAACSSLEYINSPNFGYMNRQSNLLVGTIKMPSDNSKWGASNDLSVGRGNQGYPQFNNPTTSIGSFNSVFQFDQYFRLKSGSPGNNSGDNSRKAARDLENIVRPQNGTVERGCYEGTTTGGGGGGTTNTNNWVYRDNLTSGWANWSYGGTVTLQDGGIKKNGSSAAKFYSSQSWGALSFRHNSGKTGNNLTSIKFWARKWTDDANYTARFRVRTGDGNGTVKPWRNFSPTNSFVQYSFTKAQLGNPGTVKRMDWNVANNRTLWVDDVRLVYTTSNHGTVEVELNDEHVGISGEQTEMSVFPNPNSGQFVVELKSPTDLDNVSISLSDGQGRLVDHTSLPLYAGNNRLHLNMTGKSLPAGLYFLRLVSSEGTINLTERVMIK